MDREFILQQFEEIEQKVDRVIEACNRYEKANSELKEKIRLLEEELHRKVEAEKRYEADRDFIRARIDNLVVKLEDFSVAPPQPPAGDEEPGA